MLFMVIENFRGEAVKAVYRRFAAKGRMLPDGVHCVSSWVAADLSRCFQLMEAEEVVLLQQWVAAWADLADLEIVPVAPGTATAQAIAGQL